MKKNKILIPFLFVLLAASIYGISGSISSFYNEDNPFNRTLILESGSYEISRNTEHYIASDGLNEDDISINDTPTINRMSIANAGWTITGDGGSNKLNYTNLFKTLGNVSFNLDCPNTGCSASYEFNYSSFTGQIGVKYLMKNATHYHQTKIYNQNDVRYLVLDLSSDNVAWACKYYNGTSLITIPPKFTLSHDSGTIFRDFVFDFNSYSDIVITESGNILCNFSGSNINKSLGRFKIDDARDGFGNGIYMDELWFSSGVRPSNKTYLNYANFSIKNYAYLTNMSVNFKGFDTIYTGTYPSNIRLVANEQHLLNTTGEIKETNSSTFLLSVLPINNILLANCTCSDCTKEGDNCIIKTYIYSASNGTLQTELIVETYQYGIDNCSNSYGISSNATTLNISFTNSNVNLSSKFDLVGGNYSNIEYELSSNKYCIYPSWFNSVVNVTLQYRKGNNIYNYFTTDTYLTGTTKYWNLYVDTGTAVTATVYDNTNEIVDGAIIYVQKYDFSTGNYILVGMGETNFEGETKLYLNLDTDYYRFLIYYPSTTLRLTTAPTYIYASTIEFKINLYDLVGEDYYTIESVVGNLSYNNNTNYFRFIYTDTSGTITGAKMYLYESTSKQTILINMTESSSTSGTLLIHITPTNDTIYLAKSFILLDSTEYLYDTLTVNFPVNVITSKMGLFGLFIIELIFIFVFLFSIPIGLIITPIPLVLAAWAGIIQLNLYIAILMEIAAFVLAIFINKRG